jgi:hypothetical protein
MIARPRCQPGNEATECHLNLDLGPINTVVLEIPGAAPVGDLRRIFDDDRSPLLVARRCLRPRPPLIQRTLRCNSGL